jgi:Asp-tRNA(Asn)/Glu-tRNA(Gln) amidotransferase A subunit family amidase
MTAGIRSTAGSKLLAEHIPQQDDLIVQRLHAAGAITPEEIAGVRMQTYIDWMKSAYYVTVTGHPAISVPCGFTPEGLPVGVQIVGGMTSGCSSSRSRFRRRRGCGGSGRRA